MLDHFLSSMGAHVESGSNSVRVTQSDVYEPKGKGEDILLCECLGS